MAVVIPTEDIERRFAFHPATTDDAREAHELVRATCRAALETILDAMPQGAAREGAVVATNLEQAMMWANAGIARHGPT